MTEYIYKDELYHHGIKGQRWGIRRYQNEDGTLTSEGRKRYGYITSFRMKGEANRRKALQKDVDSLDKIKDGVTTKKGKQVLSKKDVDETREWYNKEQKKSWDKTNQLLDKAEKKATEKDAKQAKREANRLPPVEAYKRKEIAKKIAIGTAITAGVLAAGYTTYKISKGNFENEMSIAQKYLSDNKHRFADVRVANSVIDNVASTKGDTQSWEKAAKYHLSEGIKDNKVVGSQIKKLSRNIYGNISPKAANQLEGLSEERKQEVKRLINKLSIPAGPYRTKEGKKLNDELFSELAKYYFYNYNS